jgi:shikimate 5-dehydrogenase
MNDKLYADLWYTPPRTHFISGLSKLLTFEMTIFGLKMMVKSGLQFFILKLNEPLQSCKCGRLAGISSVNSK